MIRFPEVDSGSLRKASACYGTERAKSTEHAKGTELGWFYVQLLLSLYTFSFCFTLHISHIKPGEQGPPVRTRSRGVLT